MASSCRTLTSSKSRSEASEQVVTPVQGDLTRPVQCCGGRALCQCCFLPGGGGREIRVVKYLVPMHLWQCSVDHGLPPPFSFSCACWGKAVGGGSSTRLLMLLAITSHTIAKVKTAFLVDVWSAPKICSKPSSSAQPAALARLSRGAVAVLVN